MSQNGSDHLGSERRPTDSETAALRAELERRERDNEWLRSTITRVATEFEHARPTTHWTGPVIFNAVVAFFTLGAVVAYTYFTHSLQVSAQDQLTELRNQITELRSQTAAGRRQADAAEKQLNNSVSPLVVLGVEGNHLVVRNIGLGAALNSDDINIRHEGRTLHLLHSSTLAPGAPGETILPVETLDGSDFRDTIIPARLRRRIKAFLDERREPDILGKNICIRYQSVAADWFETREFIYFSDAPELQTGLSGLIINYVSSGPVKDKASACSTS